MTTLTFERAWTFGWESELGSGRWLNAILGDAANYSVQANTASRLTVVGTAASGLAGWRVEVLPVTSFTAGTGAYPVSGAINTVELYDASGALVSRASGFAPVASEFSAVSSSILLPIFGAEVTGSAGDDVLAGYRNGSNTLEGGAGADRLIGGGLDDYIVGGPGADAIEAGAGDDVIEAGMGVDVINAEDGFDLVLLIEDPNQFQTVYLNQAQPAGTIRISNAELVVTGDGGSRVYGAAGQDVVLGGLGRDEMHGAGGIDVLVGLDGDDALYGGADDDGLDGGAGADLLDGGAGADYADYSLAPGALTIDLRIASAQQTGYGLDTLVRIENLYASEWGDTLTGDGQSNTLEGAGGGDVLDGAEGADNLIGGDGDDRLQGGLDNDTVSDEAGANYLRGGAGDDYVMGGVGFDDAHGNVGNDTVHGGGFDDWSVGGQGNDLVFGDDGHDLVYGQLGQDTLDGGVGDDGVVGGQANDILNGGAGNDFLTGDRGDDTVTGGVGADVFHTNAVQGLDRIADFSLAEGDRIQIDPGNAYSLRQEGADTVIDFGGGNTAVLAGVQLSTLAGGWIFGG